jgi:hypothetical protein
MHVLDVSRSAGSFLAAVAPANAGRERGMIARWPRPGLRYTGKRSRVVQPSGFVWAMGVFIAFRGGPMEAPAESDAWARPPHVISGSGFVAAGQGRSRLAGRCRPRRPWSSPWTGLPDQRIHMTLGNTCAFGVRRVSPGGRPNSRSIGCSGT